MPCPHQLSAETEKNEIMKDRINLLVRDPHCLYVYWDISENLSNMLKAQLGSEIYEKTVPALKVTNLSKKESFFIRINEFSTDWYINVREPGCMYMVEMGRKLSDSIFICILSSNNIITPDENTSSDTTIYFANYIHVRDGCYVPAESKVPVKRPEFLCNTSYSGISSMDSGRNVQNVNPFGVTSDEFVR